MNKKIIFAILIALFGSAIFGVLMAFRSAMPEPWMRSTASALAYVSIAISFALALKLKNES